MLRRLPQIKNDGSAKTTSLMRPLRLRAAAWTSGGSCATKSVTTGQPIWKESAMNCRGRTTAGESSWSLGLVGAPVIRCINMPQRRTGLSERMAISVTIRLERTGKVDSRLGMNLNWEMNVECAVGACGCIVGHFSRFKYSMSSCLMTDVDDNSSRARITVPQKQIPDSPLPRG
ncbi:hypothetical protein MPH_10997 [Macrophomina phaseolina MS6]|uniref:Uncharacterized protein n=1 Tax=Macrophomina phaseolina (strain MS6) TaxID=1126212 RepID=K2RBM2_MACPH|nr:hypothetical protein MPH_10997 [Macrophomina phaseolina MS6]